MTADSKINVLLVNDDTEDIDLLRIHLGKIGKQAYDVDGIGEFDAAVEEIGRDRHDVYLIDYRLGNLSGIDLIRTVIENGCRKPVIVLIGKGSFDVDVEAMAAGAIDYLVKDGLTPAQLERSIRYGISEIETKHALRKANDALQLTQFVVDHAGDAAFWLDPNGHLVYANDTTCNMLGYSREQLLALNIADIDPDVHQGDYDRSFERIRARSPARFEARYRTRAGAIIPVEVTIYHLRYGDKELMTCYSRDITERKQAEQALHESEKRYRDLFEHSPTAIWEKDYSAVKTMIDDLKGKGVRDFMPYFDQHPDALRDMVAAVEILDVNQATLDIYGAASKDEFIRFMTGPEGCVAKGDFPAREFAALAAGKTRFESEDVVRTLHGAEIVIYSITHIPDAHKDDWSCVITSDEDATERKRAEDQLRQARKMEVAGQLTAGVAHDFNNLMAIMLGNAELLEDLAGEDEEAKQYIEAIIESVDRGSSLTGRLLAFSCQQALSPAAIGVSELIGSLSDMLQRTLGETIDLRVEKTPHLWTATIDPNQFENAMVNLALNARDAMPQGGTLTIETANVTLDETYAERQEEVTPGDYVYVAVSDTGSGIPPEVLEKVFEPFFTTKEVGKGSGLGLSMVYGFAKQSGGHITIHSEAGHGTTVKLYMPRIGDALAKDDTKDDTREIAQGWERILVIEDDENVRKVSVRILRDQGYEVAEAVDGKEAIEHLKDNQPFDLLFTDVVLPGDGNGVEIAEEVKRIQPGIKVLYTTGHTENAVVHNRQPGLDVTLINKPYRRAELLEKVREIFSSEDV